MIAMSDTSGIRRRKGEEVQNSEGERVEEKTNPTKGERIDKTFTWVLLVFGVLTIGLVCLLQFAPDHQISLSVIRFGDTLLYTVGLCSPVYAVVLDAGSTGSRVLAFTFSRNPATHQLVLRDELWREVKLGLSSFATDPQAGADTIEQLLGMAKERIPQSAWAEVPVTLMATAGLRLLPQEQSEALISAVRSVLDNSGFRNEGVDIMSELNEGVFGWMTVNYLLDQLHLPRKSYVALDLGGGSTQITFLPKYQETLDRSPQSYLHPVQVLSNNQTLYSHSYLGLGLMAAREAIFKLGDPEDSLEIVTACISGSQQWKFHSKEYTVVPDKSTGYEFCMLEVQQFLDSLQIDQCDEVPTRKIAAFSYFHDRAIDSGILPPGQMTGVVTVQQYLDSAKSVCSSPDPDQPFLCVDLTFISALLHHGYRLEADAKLGLYKEIDGHQTSWALGAAFNLLK